MLQSIAWQLSSSIAACLQKVAPRRTIAVAGSSDCAYSMRRIAQNKFTPNFRRNSAGESSRGTYRHFER